MKPSVPFDLLEDKHIMSKLALSIYIYILKTKALIYLQTTTHTESVALCSFYP